MKTKTKHNKKRNTAFLYEALVREIAKSVINKEPQRNDIITSLIKEHFVQGGEMAKELELYRALGATENLDSYTAEKLIQEAKNAHEKINKKKFLEPWNLKKAQKHRVPKREKRKRNK